MPSSKPKQSLAPTEISKHSSSSSAWIVLDKKVIDVTSYLPNHPGGASLILATAGRDASAQFEAIHPEGTLSQALKNGDVQDLGQIEGDVSELERQRKPSSSPSSNIDDPKSVDECLNLDEIEQLATRQISKQGWAYYYSASDDLVSKRYNHEIYSKILLRPRIFVDITKCSLETTILGNKVKTPIFVSPAAMAGLGHPSGEEGIAEACAAVGAIQIISFNASMAPEKIVENAPPEQVFGWQIYVQVDRKKSETMLRRINKLKQIKFLVLTLDAAIPGKREDDERMGRVGGSQRAISSVQVGEETGSKEEAEVHGVGKQLFVGTAADLAWHETLRWLRQHTSLPIVLKGIQTHEDAYMATRFTSRHGGPVAGIILSNHGGRAADTAPPAIHTLLEIKRYCAHVLSDLEVFVDGGIKRGTDVVKALCLGAKAVGIGRAALWGLAAGGSHGVKRTMDILNDETQRAVRLLGKKDLNGLDERCVNVKRVLDEVYDGQSALTGPGLWHARTLKL